MTFTGPFQPKLFYDSMIQVKVLVHLLCCCFVSPWQ